MFISRKVCLAIGVFLLAAEAGSHAAVTWTPDYSAALKQAAAENKPILLNFTGSTWCPPCIQMEKKVLSQPEFEDFATKNLVLVRVDFASPYGPAPSEFSDQHVYLAQRFGVQGFPTFILLNSKGVPMAQEMGPFATTPKAFIQWVKQVEKNAQ